MAFTTILNEHFITLSVNLTVNMTVICLLVCCFFHSSAVDGLKKKEKIYISWRMRGGKTSLHIKPFLFKLLLTNVLS